ncbi:MAG: helix-hairpin-helix domain-containing protein, partial [Bacillota bacterium]|nr:helix-hairpin-helix domain-containing protein [Bacillota bacterium]
NKTRSGSVSPPDICPVCGSKTEIHKERDIQTLHCPNADCPAKKIKAFTLFVSRNALNIEGLSEATIEKMVDEGIVKTPADLFRLENWKDQIVAMDGFGEKSYNNLVGAAKTAGKTTPERLLYGLGIPNIGVSNAKMIARACQNSWKKIQELTQEELTEIEGVGDIMAKAYVEFFDEDDNKALVKDLLEVLDLDEGFVEYDNKLEDKTFVITGSLNSFKSRNEAKARIEELGGKVAGSVSQRTDYLINNDRESNSSKNKKAKELDIPIITEEEFISMIN